MNRCLTLLLFISISLVAQSSCSFDCDPLQGVPLRGAQAIQPACLFDAYFWYQECLRQADDLRMSCMSWMSDRRGIYWMCMSFWPEFLLGCELGYLQRNADCSAWDWFIHTKQNDLQDCLMCCSIPGCYSESSRRMQKFTGINIPMVGDLFGKSLSTDKFFFGWNNALGGAALFVKF